MVAAVGIRGGAGVTRELVLCGGRVILVAGQGVERVGLLVVVSGGGGGHMVMVTRRAVVVGEHGGGCGGGVGARHVGEVENHGDIFSRFL